MDSDNKYLIVTINHSHAGFFAYVNFALNQITYAERNGLVPVVHYGPISGDGPNAFFDENAGPNMWDYYFEPVAGLTHADLEQKLQAPDDPLAQENVTSLSSEELWRIHCDEPESIFPYPHSMHFHSYKDDPEWYDKQRNRAQRVVEQYLKIKPHVAEKVETFKADNFSGEPVLGVHMRGTDKGAAEAPVELMRIVQPKEYYPHIDAFIDEHGACQIFAASDQQQYINQLKRRYGTRVLSYDAIRTRGKRNPFELEDGNGYRKGEDVLIDCLLLSNCDHLLKCTSAVGEFAMYFNPDLDCIDLNHEGKGGSRWELRAVRKKQKWYGKYLDRKREAFQRGGQK